MHVGDPLKSRPRKAAGAAEDRSAPQVPRDEGELALADFRQSIALVQTAGRIEHDLAETLRAMAREDNGVAAARRLRLADDAARAEQAAAETSERLRQRARWQAEQDDVIALSLVLEHAATLLLELAREENDVAGILSDLARGDRPELAPRRQHLAADASVAAKRAGELAYALLAEADTGAARPEEIAADSGVDPATSFGSALDQRLADLDRRIAELRQASQGRPSSDDPVHRSSEDVQWSVHQAELHCQQSAAHLLQTRQLAVEAFNRAASAHDRAADANARSAAAGIGDVAEHQKMTQFHRTAARADRQRAQELREKAANQK